MKIRFKEHKLFGLFLCCINKDIMLNYQPVRYFMGIYLNVHESFIRSSVTEFVSDEKVFIEKKTTFINIRSI